MKHRLYLYVIFGFLFLSASVSDSKDTEKHPPHAHEAMKTMETQKDEAIKQQVVHAHENMKIMDSSQAVVDLEEKIGQFIPAVAQYRLHNLAVIHIHLAAVRLYKNFFHLFSAFSYHVYFE